jgi:hypothetical protein
MADSANLVVIENYADFRKKIKALDSGLDSEVKVGMRKIGKQVATQAKAIAGVKGLRDSGELIRKIAPSVRMDGTTIRAKAMRSTGKRAPFPYPAIYEYGGRGGGSTGPRAFLGPAVEAMQDEIRQEVENIVDETMRKAGWR